MRSFCAAMNFIILAITPFLYIMQFGNQWIPNKLSIWFVISLIVSLLLHNFAIHISKKYKIFHCSLPFLHDLVYESQGNVVKMKCKNCHRKWEMLAEESFDDFNYQELL